MNDALVPRESEGCRLDAFLSENWEITRSGAQKQIEKGNVTVNGKVCPKSFRLTEGDVISFNPELPVPMEAVAQNIPLDIVYEDNDLIVVNKPKGMVVHPAPGNPDGTLVNALLWHCGDSLSGINGVIRPGIVHRIDKDTSGLLMVAKNDAAHVFLAEQIKDHSFEREYETIVVGNIKDDEGTVNAPIDRNPGDRKKMAVVEGGRAAVSHYRVIGRYEGYTHLKVALETGRTHQIRVHMSYIGHPVLGDGVYGGTSNGFVKKHPSLLNGQCLHAKVLGFTHPNGEKMRFESELPEYFEKVLLLLKGNK